MQTLYDLSSAVVSENNAISEVDGKNSTVFL